MKITVLDRERWILTVTGILTPAECQEWIDLAEGIGFDSAPISTAFGFVHAPEVRNNTRVMLDDFDRAAALWTRVRDHVPEKRERSRVLGLNERFRLYRYDPGQYFRWHFDGAFERAPGERSLLTLMIYLNDGMKGGATEFDDVGAVVPETGKALFFQHAVRHQGAPVESGRKYVLRTDVMYRTPRSP
ncbi:MAG TPA: 2OG-Fe(II) oxygenase [Planctomycetota bacterium]|nr:2OG-Fe(II) oxygenase [Planctomycetota bacterium]